MGSGEVKKGSMFMAGIFISAANPYFLLWWAVIGLGFIMQSYQSFLYFGGAVYFLGHIAADVIWYGLVSIVVGKTRKFIREKPYRMIMALLGVLLVFFGGKFFFGAVSTYWLNHVAARM